MLEELDDKSLIKLTEFDDKIIDLDIEIAKKEGRYEKLGNIYETRCACWVAKWYETLDTGDILIFKYKTPPEWASIPGVGKWHHAGIVYDKKYLAEAPGEGLYSRKKLLSDFNNSSKYEEIAIIKMGLNYKEKEDIKKYIDNNLLNKPYTVNKNDSRFEKIKAFTSSYGKERMDKFYCSSLVWRAHFSSGKKVDIDGDFLNPGVLPRELLTSTSVLGKIEYKKL